MKPNFIFSCFLFFTSTFILAQECEIKGKLINSKGEPIPFAAIYIADLGKSAMANELGEFNIQGNCQTYVVKFQSLGYQSNELKINFQEKKLHKIKLKQVAYQLQEVNITPGKEDPAYNIIRKATVMAEFYKHQIEAYTAKLYLRNTFDFKSFPWLLKKMLTEEELDYILSGNVEESVVEYSFRKPNTIKKVLIASKDSKDSNAMGSGADYINLNFYNLGGSGVVNPLSRGAFHFYKFEYQHSFYQGSLKVHKIKIIPRRNGNDLMHGDIYINDGIWNINQVNVILEQDLAEIQYKQIYQEVEELVWMPVNHQIKALAKFMGLEVDMLYLATLKNITVETNEEIDQKIRASISTSLEEELKDEENAAAPQLQKNEAVSKSKNQKEIDKLIQKEELNNRETFKLIRLIQKEEKRSKADSLTNYELQRNYTFRRKDTLYTNKDSIWEVDRSIPLTQTEEEIYAKNDSLKSSPFDTNFESDSAKSAFSKILNKTFFNKRSIYTKERRVSFQPNGLLTGLSGVFNTVDGWRLDKEIFNFRWENYQARFLEITPSISYAFARKRWMGKVSFLSQYNKQLQARIYGSIGRNTTDYNQPNEMPDWINTLSTLTFSSNYKKLYENDFATLGHQIEPLNGFKIDLSATYSKRKVLQNHSEQKWLTFLDKEYTPNIPQHPPHWLERNIYPNDNFKINASIRYTPRQFYKFDNSFSDKNSQYTKKPLQSKYPTFGVDYEQGIAEVYNSNGDYQFLSLSIQQKFSHYLIDEIAYHLESGGFLNNKQLSFSDYKSFNTAPFYLTEVKESSFKTMGYYAYNSREQYIQAHLQIENNFILLKHLPYLNKTNLKEELHFAHLYTSDRKSNYSEVGYSLNRIFLFVNAGVYVGFENFNYRSTDFRISINIKDLMD